jgi:hypothetical protein
VEARTKYRPVPDESCRSCTRKKSGQSDPLLYIRKKLRGIDAGHEVLQVFVDPLKLKKSESGEDRKCRHGRMSASSGKGEWRFEFEGKLCESGQCGEASDHRLR